MAKNLLNKYDFRQEILSQGCDIEVLEPKWFRDEVAEISKHMWNTPEIIPTKEDYTFSGWSEIPENMPPQRRDSYGPEMNFGINLIKRS